MNDRPTIIRMWSGPRNLSTALMRSWENRPDTAVMDEPLYAFFLATTGLDHPMGNQVISAGPADWDEAIDRCLHPRLEPGQTVSYQKQMAHHLLPECDLTWIDDAVNVLLLRHPRRVIASYVRLRERPTLLDLGFPQLTMLRDRLGDVPVVEADGFLADPEAGLRRLCEHAELEFQSAMLDWPQGPRPSDGVWASHWYGSVEQSSGFAPAPTDDPDRIELPPEAEGLAAEAMTHYHALLAGD